MLAGGTVLALLASLAAAEDFLELSVGAVDASAYPTVAIDLRVRWEDPSGAGVGQGWAVRLEEAGAPVEGAVVWKEKHGDADDIVRVSYTSALAAPSARELRIRLDRDDFHNGDGDTLSVLGEIVPNAWMVIAGGSADPMEARQLVASYNASELPTVARPQELRSRSTHAHPRLEESTWVHGLKDGFHIVVAATVTREDVARELVAALKALGRDAYYRKVWVADPEDVRLYVVDGIVNPYAADFQVLAAELEISGVGRARSGVAGERAVIPYVWPAKAPTYASLRLGITTADWFCDGPEIPVPAATAPITRHTLPAPIGCMGRDNP